MDEWTVIFGVGSVILTILLVGGALAGVILAGQAGIRARFDDLRTEMSGRFDDLRGRDVGAVRYRQSPVRRRQSPVR